MVSSMGSRALVSLRPAIQATGRLAVAPVGLPRSVRKLIAWPGSGRAAVVSQQPAQPLAATHVGAPERADLWCDQLVAEPLMVPLPMVVRHELVDGAEQPTFPEEDQAVQTLRPDRAHEALRVGVGIGRLDGRQHDPYPALWTIRRNPSVHLLSRSQMSTWWRARNPSTASVSRRAACAMNHPSGVGVEPAT